MVLRILQTVSDSALVQKREDVQSSAETTRHGSEHLERGQSFSEFLADYCLNASVFLIVWRSAPAIAARLNPRDTCELVGGANLQQCCGIITPKSQALQEAAPTNENPRVCLPTCRRVLRVRQSFYYRMGHTISLIGRAGKVVPRRKPQPS